MSSYSILTRYNLYSYHFKLIVYYKMSLNKSDKKTPFICSKINVNVKNHNMTLIF